MQREIAALNKAPFLVPITGHGGFSLLMRPSKLTSILFQHFTHFLPGQLACIFVKTYSMF